MGEIERRFYIESIKVLIVFLILLVLVFRNARKMGYSGSLWLIVSLLYWPLASLYLLASLPNRKLAQKREKEIRLLKQQLAKRGLISRQGSADMSDKIIGDDAIDGTIGDEYTRG